MPDIASIGPGSPGSMGPIDRAAPSGPRRDAPGVDAPRRPEPAPERPGDRVEVSQDARNLEKYLSRIHRLPEGRAEHVDRIRAEIADGTYETPDKIETAIDRLLDDLLD